MERNTNNETPFTPVIARLRSISRALGRLAGFLPLTAPDHMSNHKVPFEEPYTWHYPALPQDTDSIEYWRAHHEPDDIFDPQMPFVMNHPEADMGWDSEGNYHDDDLATIIPLFPDAPKDVA